VAGENFIELLPLPTMPLRPLLAILNSGLTEVTLRVSAHVYGGGVYNLSPGSVGKVPVVDVRCLSPATLQQLDTAYGQFLLSGGKDRMALDTVVLAAAGFPADFLTTLRQAQKTLQEFSHAVVEPVAVQEQEERGWPEELRLL
jgi:hypothetical protein